ncbi:MAG TPA: VCBS repeat-containing protein [Pyrinomonadaceae bacterium]|nr:VCBS repeat-containing protein [Pyrinomonadaceae bacterium]
MKIFSPKAIKATALLLFVSMFSLSVSAQIKLRKALDFDNDGKADYVIFRPSDSVWYVLKSSGGSQSQAWGLPTDDYLTPGDYDGDGKADYAVWRRTDGFFYWINSSNSTVTTIQWGIDGDEPVARDYDGDGKTDPTQVRRQNGNMYWYVLGSAGLQQFYTWGITSDFVAPGDYDGDGKFDPAVERCFENDPSRTCEWYVLKSTGGMILDYWGILEDIVVPGDYDGDGKTDIAVTRGGPNPTSGVIWFIKPSSGASSYAVEWGVTATDFTVQNDYDGDGKTDIAMWRESTGEFYVVKSTGGTGYALWGIPGDFPVAGYDSH